MLILLRAQRRQSRRLITTGSPTTRPGPWVASSVPAPLERMIAALSVRRACCLLLVCSLAATTAAAADEFDVGSAGKRDSDPVGRVARARVRLSDSLPAAFLAQGVRWPPREVFLRAIKQEEDGRPGVLELWAGNGGAPLALVLSHRICALSGTAGPKRREGDLQIPEGYYQISLLNPRSIFHLSLQIDYPNASDRIRGRLDDPRAALGDAIMVHGDCVTIGCIPIQDEPIEEVYLSVAAALARGPVPIHIFPRRLPDAAALQALQTTTTDPRTQTLWAELAMGWQAFEATRRVPRVRVLVNGDYDVQPTLPPGRRTQ